MADVQNRVRVGGSGFTVFRWRGQPLAFARQVAHTSPRPVGPGAVPIQPMDAAYPVQVITPAAAGMGTITLDLYELYGANVWERLGAQAKMTMGVRESAAAKDANALFDGAIDIVNIFRVQAASEPIQVVKYIKPPTLAGKNLKAYTEEYHNAVITDVVDGETIEIGTMEILKQITVGYTHMTRGGVRGDDVVDETQPNRNANTTAFN